MPERSATVPSWVVDAVLVGTVVLIGALIRWPNLWLVPTFTDETAEAVLAMRIFRDEVAPLTNVEPYIGALWNYLLAAGFWAFGLNPWLPRLFAFVAGALTVGATYWLGRELGGRLGGPVAGTFMATCSTHALVNSHVGWSHATTPLWATLGLACLARALCGRASSGRWLVLAGLSLGLAVQTHVTAVLLLPGAALAVLLCRPTLLRTRWTAFAAVAFVLAISNLVAFNVQTAGGSFSAGQQVLADYSGDEGGTDVSDYLGNLGRLTLALSWVLSGAIEKRRFVNESLADPRLVLYLGTAVAAVAWAAWRRYPLPLLVTVPYLLALPFLTAKYEPMLNGRYLVPVLPLVFASIGLATGNIWCAAQRRLGGSSSMVVAVVLTLGIGGLAAYPLVPMSRYVQAARTNHAILAAHEVILADRQPGEVVLLDYGLDGVFFMAAGSAFKSMELLLTGSGIPYVVIDARAASVGDALAGETSRLLVLNADKASPLGRAFALTPLMPGGGRNGPGFDVYRVAAAR